MALIAKVGRAPGGTAYDLGCGTGLMGLELRSTVRRLEGVDVSEAMLAEARRKDIYDRLVKDDLIDFLRASEPAVLVTATDVLASGIGPGALANMTATVAGSPCTVRMGVVWEVGGDGRIGREDVYYDAGSLLECGWVR